MTARDLVLWDAWCSFIEWLKDLYDDIDNRLHGDESVTHGWWSDED